jgi:hypothetical protein
LGARICPKKVSPHLKRTVSPPFMHSFIFLMLLHGELTESPSFLSFPFAQT